MATSRKKKAATPVSGQGFMIRVLRSPRRLGVKKAQLASEIFHLHGAKTTVETATMTMFVELPDEGTLRKINNGLKELGLRIIKSTKVAAAYEWEFGTVLTKREETTSGQV